jgi:hypothetical protein
MSTKPSVPTPDIVIGARQLSNPTGIVPTWDAPGEGAPGDMWGPAPTRLPRGATLQSIPLVTGPAAIDISNPAPSDVLPGLRGVKRK